MPRIRKLPEAQRNADLSRYIKKAMLDREWNNNHLAELLGMTASQVSVVVNNPLGRNLKTLLRVTDKLGVNLLNPEI